MGYTMQKTNNEINIASVNSFEERFINNELPNPLQRVIIEKSLSPIMLNEQSWSDWQAQLKCNGITIKQSADYMYEKYGIVIPH